MLVLLNTRICTWTIGILQLNAIRYAFLELGVDDGIIVARTDSEGAGLTQKLPVSQEPGD